MVSEARRSNACRWATRVALLYAALSVVCAVLADRLVGPPWWAGSVLNGGYVTWHAVRALCIFGVAWAIRRAGVSRGSRAFTVGLCAIVVEVGVNWLDVIEWVAEARLCVTGYDSRFHTCSALREWVRWAGAPGIAGIMSAGGVDVLLKDRAEEEAGGRTRG